MRDGDGFAVERRRLQHGVVGEVDRPDRSTWRPSSMRMRAVASSTTQCSSIEVTCTSWSSSMGGACHLAATVSSSAASTRATSPVEGV